MTAESELFLERKGDTDVSVIDDAELPVILDASESDNCVIYLASHHR